MTDLKSGHILRLRLNLNLGLIMDALFEKLEARGFSLTHERRLLIERLSSVEDHFDAEELYVKLRTEGVPVSRATLYRTLDLLVELGYLRRFSLERGKARYERQEGQPLHGHLYCTGCGQVEDFPAPELERLGRLAFERYGFEVHQPELKIAGRCSRCRGLGSSLSLKARERRKEQ